MELSRVVIRHLPRIFGEYGRWSMGILAHEYHGQEAQGDIRNARVGTKPFCQDNGQTKNRKGHRDSINRKATIVVEHLIQASDVAHTMQHWHSYRKWKERLFHELYMACKNGRSKSKPGRILGKGRSRFL